jgi:hypothetical protein
MIRHQKLCEKPLSRLHLSPRLQTGCGSDAATMVACAMFASPNTTREREAEAAAQGVSRRRERPVTAPAPQTPAPSAVVAYAERVLNLPRDLVAADRNAREPYLCEPPTH